MPPAEDMHFESAKEVLYKFWVVAAYEGMLSSVGILIRLSHREQS